MNNTSGPKVVPEKKLEEEDLPAGAYLAGSPCRNCGKRDMPWCLGEVDGEDGLPIRVSCPTIDGLHKILGKNDIGLINSSTAPEEGWNNEAVERDCLFEIVTVAHW